MLTTAANWQIISRVFFRYYPLSFAFNLALALGFLSFVYLKQAYRSRASILTFASATVRYRIGSVIVEMDHRYLFMYQTVKFKD
jgi:hypothetical protein